jgi:ADP-ribose pyrophosphatase YjhB (NUDIX family)
MESCKNHYFLPKREEMTTERKFAAFVKDGREGMGIVESKEDGFCISAFLLIKDKENPRRVLLGKLNQDAPWDHIGALIKSMREDYSKGWMIPSSHLLYGESPLEAAKRIAREQLEVDPATLGLTSPKVDSEVYASKRHPERKNHWDMEFLFEGKASRSDVLNKAPRAWRMLDFVDIDKVNKSEIVRSHEDILARL